MVLDLLLYCPRRSPLVATCSLAAPGCGKKRQHTCTFLRSTAARELGTQLLCPATHLGPREVTGKNKPCSKAKLAENPSVRHKDLLQWTSNTLKLQWQGGRGGREKRKTEHKMYNNRKTHNWNSQEKPKIATGAVVTAQMCAEGGGADQGVK